VSSRSDTAGGGSITPPPGITARRPQKAIPPSPAPLTRRFVVVEYLLVFESTGRYKPIRTKSYRIHSMSRFDHGQITGAKCAVEAGQHGELGEMPLAHWRAGHVTQIMIIL
jgi:hypothetical protein